MILYGKGYGGIFKILIWKYYLGLLDVFSVNLRFFLRGNWVGIDS